MIELRESFCGRWVATCGRWEVERLDPYVALAAAVGYELASLRSER